MRKLEMKHACMNKKQLKLMNLMRPKKKKLKSALKEEIKKEQKLLKVINFFFKKRKNKRTIRKKKTRNKMWGRLGKLNKEFRDIRVHNKNNKKMSKYILRM